MIFYLNLLVKSRFSVYDFWTPITLHFTIKGRLEYGGLEIELLIFGALHAIWLA